MSLLETVKVNCPYCGEPFEVVVDCTLGAQEYIEDCYVCCRPVILTVSPGGAGEVSVNARAEDEV